MHISTKAMLSYLGLAEVGLWAAKVNEGTETVFVIKLSTDTLKWIQRGVPVNMLIGHVQVENALIRVVGLEVFDCNMSPLLPNLPQIEKWEIENFDTLLALNRFSMHFHNEQPFVSVLDATGSLQQEAAQAYLKKRSFLQFHTSPVLTDLFRKAQNAFLPALAKPTPNVELFRFPLSIANPTWTSIDVPDAGTFTPNDFNEGQLSAEWWAQLRTDLFNSFKDAELPPVVVNSDAVMTLGEITAKFSELLLAVEVEEGHVIAKKAGEGM
jgi:hypothetical protein